MAFDFKVVPLKRRREGEKEKKNMHDYSKLSGTRRMRFREWLISKLDSGEITGVQWLDKRRGVFKIPWKHGSGRNWCPTDANIFKEWAKHSGKFVEGRDRADPCKWKTNFRCTLNALPDFEEIRQQSIPRGPDAYKIYRLNKKQSDLVKKEEKSKLSEKAYLTQVVLRINYIHAFRLI